MSQAKDGGFHLSSPRSSSGIPDSFKGTPDTRLTVFSPDEGSSFKLTNAFRGLALAGSESPQERIPSANYRISASQLAEDPFGMGTRLQQELPPVTSAFQPILSRSTVATPLGNHEPLGNLAGAISNDLSVNQGISRCLIITPKSPDTGVLGIQAHLGKLDEYCRHGQSQVNVYQGRVCVIFSDIRDAVQVCDFVQTTTKDWDVRYLPASEFFKNNIEARFSLGSRLSIIARAIQPSDVGLVTSQETVQCILKARGQVFAFLVLSGFEYGRFEGVVEYCDAATAAAASCNKLVIDGVEITMVSDKNELGSSWPFSGHVDAHRSQTRRLGHAFQSMGMASSQLNGHCSALASMPFAGCGFRASGAYYHPSVGMLPVPYHHHFSHGIPYGMASGQISSFAGPFLAHRSHMQLQSVGNLGRPPPDIGLVRPLAHRQHAARLPRSHYRYSASNNVDLDRIQDGVDVRTTIMLRNIPNKIDQAMLKQIIDESSRGKFDFMYLRIDFANACNVGYAFINFVDPLDIIDFVNMRSNQRWNCFRSDKVAEISYATIQGKDCLVQKFRNSCVMLEAPHFRPKLYHTLNGPNPELAGQEEPFPGPDNQSKMRRSCENAEHVGLFLPYTGHNSRDEPRRRRSQFDRGTRFAALEEYNYGNSIRAVSSP